jgi:type IV secretory pathway VirB2 component (pilin)
MYQWRYFIVLGLAVIILGAALIAGRVDGDAFVAAVTALFSVFCGAGAYQSGQRGGK